MSADLEYACSFRDSNAEILNLIKLGVYKHDPSTIKEILNDKHIKSKLSKILNYYTKPNQQSKSKLTDALKWAGTQPLSNMMKTFLAHLALKLDLDEELTFRLVELFFINHPSLFEKVKSTESEEIKKELSVIIRPITLLYYKERINLIKAVTALLMGSENEDNPSQAVFLEFTAEGFSGASLQELVWQQYTETCKRELPSQVFVPHEREEWFLQVLEEEKILIELLVLSNNTQANVTAQMYLDYLSQYVRQDFQGSYKNIIHDLHLQEYRNQQKKLVQEIGDLCMFHLLSCIHLDIFVEKGAIPEFNASKNPYNLISDKEYTHKINKFFVTLSEGSEFVSEHIGPVIVSWIALLTWGQGLPSAYTMISNFDMSPIESLASNYYIFDFFQKLTKREPFIGPNLDLSCTVKYILMSLISRLHTALHVENAKNYSLLVKTTCACLDSVSSSETLKHFWQDDFPNRSGLYLMLEILSKKYPHSAEEFLQFVSVLIGDSSSCFAPEMVEYLDKLQYFTISVYGDAIEEVGEGRFQCAYEMSSTRIVIPRGTIVESVEQVNRDQFLVTWNIRFSLWPVLFNYWEFTLDSLKQGHTVNDSELRILSQYLEILSKIIILDPSLSALLETNGLRQPANNPLEVKVTVKPRDMPNQIISEYLLDTFIELSRIHNPPLDTLSGILVALKGIYSIELENIAQNPLTQSFKKIIIERHGFGSLNSPHPLFASLSKLRVFEKSTENYAVTYSMLELCNTIFQNNACLKIFPMSSTTILSEALKYCLSEVMPECLNMSGLYKWRNSQLVLGLLVTLLSQYSYFIDNNSKTCAYIDLISNSLNKVNISGFLETVLQVIAQQTEFNEMNFFNVYWLQADDLEEILVIKNMISTGLSALEKILDIVLYIHENGNNSFIIQAPADVYRLIYQNSSNEELPIVSALLSYVPFSLKNADENETIPTLSLRCLTKIVLVWEKSNQKAYLEYFTTGTFQEIKKEFSKSFEDCFCDKSSFINQDLRVSVTLAFLEFLIVSVRSQKAFVSYIISNIDLSNEIKRNFQVLRDLNKENITLTSLTMLFHIISLYEQLVLEGSKYPSISSKLMQDTVLLNSVVSTVETLLFTKREPQGFEFCLFIHSYASVFRILTCYLQQKSYASIEPVFQLDLLENFLNLICRTVSSESNIVRLQDIETQLLKLGSIAAISEFFVLQSHRDPYWKLFESNPVQYGTDFKYNATKLSLLLSSQEVFYDIIEATYKTFHSASTETSLVDSQLVGLSSFKSALAFIVSLGYTGKPNSGLHYEVGMPEVKPLPISSKKVLHENLRESFEFISTIVEITWKGIISETNYKHPDVISCINEKFEILMYCFSFIIHMTSTKMQQKSDDSEKSKTDFRRLSGKILAEVIDFFNALKQPSHEMLSFVLMMLSYFSKTCGFESKPEDYLYALVQHISKFIYLESPNFALLVSCLEYCLQLSDRREYVNIFKSLPSNRIIIEKLNDDKCTDLEYLSIVKYFVSMCKTVQGTKFLLSLRFLQYISLSPNLKLFQNEYTGRQRDPKHVIWCWTIVLLTQISEVMSTDQISLSQVMTFTSDFNSRIVKVLEFNYFTDGKNGEILPQKQFSMAYLEELELLLSFISRVVEGYSLLKKNDKDKVDYWVYLIGIHTTRIFNSTTDILYVFPYITEHEQRLSLRVPSESIGPDRQAVEIPKSKRSIFDPVPRTQTENKLNPSLKAKSHVSLFSYRVQNILGLTIELVLNVLISIYQINRNFPQLDLNNLIGASKFIVSVYSSIANNTNFYTNLDKMLIEEFREPDINSMSGGISQRYEIKSSSFTKILKRSFEMIFYVVMKFDLSKNIDLKQICQGVLIDWIKITDSETFKGEPKDPYLAYILDQIST